MEINISEMIRTATGDLSIEIGKVQLEVYALKIEMLDLKPGDSVLEKEKRKLEYKTQMLKIEKRINCIMRVCNFDPLEV